MSDCQEFWSRYGIPAERANELNDWLCAARVSSVSGGKPAQRLADAFLDGVDAQDLQRIVQDERVTYSKEVTSEMLQAVRRAEMRFPGLRHLLWTGNVLHGEQVLALAPRGRSVFPTDAGDVMLELWRAGAVKPLRFQPSTSGAAFLGLDTAYRGPQREPNAGTACQWTWEVLVDA